MTVIKTRKRALPMLGLVLAILLVTAWPVLAEDVTLQQTTPATRSIDPAVQSIWTQTDGPVANHEIARTWIWGPSAIVSTTEYYQNSPTGFRTNIYFDKGRLDILDPTMSSDDLWYVSGALLSSELLSGRIQLGEETFVQREPADIAIVGDYRQSNPVTYASLSKLSSVWTDPQRFGSRVGQPVTDLLRPDGTVVADGASAMGVSVSSYEEITGHNIAGPFLEWAANYPLPWAYLLGLPITEPYWVNAQVGGESRMALVQVFERRVLTYTPGNSPGWEVESGNMGLHYRLWRGLPVDEPIDAEFAPLAYDVPFGEELVSAALERYVDPYMLVSVMQVSSGGNPFASESNGGIGLMAVRESELQGVSGSLYDPQLNAEYGSKSLAHFMVQFLDWRSILGAYYAGGTADWSNWELTEWVDEVLSNYDRLIAEYGADVSEFELKPPAATIRADGEAIGEGPAAYYRASYDAAFWHEAMRKHSGWGNAIDDWKTDPNEYYCVHPDYLVGERLRLVANGVTLDCTIGDRVATPHQTQWRAKWAVEMNWPLFVALGLDKNNNVQVFYLDPTTQANPTPVPVG